MRFSYEINEDAGRIYAVDVRLKGGRINWECGSCSTLVIRCPYGTYLFGQMEEFLARLSAVPMDPGGFTALEFDGSRFGARIVGSQEKNRDKGCGIPRGAYSYMVLPALEEDGAVRVFAPLSDRQARRQKIDVPACVKIRCSREMVRQRTFLRTKEYPSGFIIADTDQLELSDYQDGDLCFRLDERVLVPLTRPMLQRKIYFKADELPRIVSRKPGIKVTVEV